MKNILFVICIQVIFLSCKDEKSSILKTINISKQMETSFHLSNIADSIIYYPIHLPIAETRINRIEIEVLTKHIYCVTGYKVYMFDRNSLNLIKSIYLGHPFTEGYFPYQTITNTAFPFEQEELFICPRRVEKGNNVFYSSGILNTITEEWEYNMNFPDYGFYQINDYALYRSLYPLRITKKDTLIWYNKQMEYLKEEPLEDIILDFTYPINHNCINFLHNKIYYHAPTSTTIYEISPTKSPEALYKFELGEYKSNYKEFADFDITKRKDEQFNTSPYYHLRNVQISERYIWGAYNYKGQTFAILFNKANGQTYILPTRTFLNKIYYPITEGGLTNDLDGGLDFWPRRISKYGEIYTWYNIEDLKAKVSQNNPKQMKNPEAARRLKEMLDNLPKEVNYIIAVLKENK